MTTIISTDTIHTLPARTDGTALWLSAADFERVSGYALKPEGFCRGDVCIPIPPGRSAEFRLADAIDLAAFAALTDRPLVSDRNGDCWVLEEPVDARNETLRSLRAPDFELPDLTGATHRLSDYRGNKVLIASWASW
jgi:AhpC/TSA family